MNDAFINMIQQQVKDARRRDFENSPQLSLGELIDQLKATVNDQADKHVRFDFEYLHPLGLSSYRGYYDELAIRFEEKGEMLVSNFIKMLEEAVGKTYEGWKGGDYVMSRATPMWVANNGNCGGTAVVGVKDRGWETIILTKVMDD